MSKLSVNKFKNNMVTTIKNQLSSVEQILKDIQKAKNVKELERILIHVMYVYESAFDVTLANLSLLTGVRKESYLAQLAVAKEMTLHAKKEHGDNDE